MGAALLLAGCGSDAKVIEGEIKTAGNEEAEETDGETADEVEAEDKEQASEGVSEASHKGYVFVYHDIVLYDKKIKSMLIMILLWRWMRMRLL